MENALADARTFMIDGRTFIQVGEAAFEVVRDGAAALAAPEVGGVALVGAAVLVAGAPAVPVSREEAMHLGAQERAVRDHTIANANGNPIALPEPSPFSNEAFVSHLPTQAELDRGITVSPRPVAGSPPMLEARAQKVDLANARDQGATKAEMDKCRPGGFKGFETQAGLDAHMLSQGKFRGEDWQLHHLVEQTRGAQAFGSQAVQNEANGIYLPSDVHRDISAQMSSGYTARDGTRYSQYRDYVDKMPYDQQRNLGMKMVRDALDRTNAPQEVRKVVEEELKALDHPELRDFCKPAQQQPGLDPLQLQQFVEQHNDTHGSKLPNAREVAPWDGKARQGSFLDIGNGQVAQHQGQGNYAIMDVQRDLGGIQPPIGQLANVSQLGQAQSFQIQAPTQGIEIGIAR